MSTVAYYEIVIPPLRPHQDKPLGRLRYTHDGELHESAIYTIVELNEILQHWRRGELLGTFGLHPLSEDATFQLVEE